MYAEELRLPRETEIKSIVQNTLTTQKICAMNLLTQKQNSRRNSKFDNFKSKSPQHTVFGKQKGREVLCARPLASVCKKQMDGYFDIDNQTKKYY